MEDPRKSMDIQEEAMMDIEIKDFQKWIKHKSPYFNHSTIRLEEVAIYVMQLRKRFAKAIKEVQDERNKCSGI